MSGKRARQTRKNKPHTVKAHPSNTFTDSVTFNPDGSRTIQLTQQGGDYLQDYMKFARAEYLRVWGREMRGDDPIFPDWDAPFPRPMTPAQQEAEMVAAMEEMGLDPALIYAFQHSGVLVTEANHDIVPADALAEWDAAIERFHATHA